jgi:hypothetical protein
MGSIRADRLGDNKQPPTRDRSVTFDVRRSKFSLRARLYGPIDAHRTIEHTVNDLFILLPHNYNYWIFRDEFQ